MITTSFIPMLSEDCAIGVNGGGVRHTENNMKRKRKNNKNKLISTCINRLTKKTYIYPLHHAEKFYKTKRTFTTRRKNFLKISELIDFLYRQLVFWFIRPCFRFFAAI